ncbi:type VII secretion-associated serine protease mycosin [Actinoplanes octamycinicus]|uniref:Type VII secretion-associated serine protease mycosin n=1 Tax=Actinoplanes octamycinicus TaxID=135948 RepID=A0A7W7MCH9_9ACTN|nr:S8 family serine peptidase [Actinoplanes octamycinicus]MBB4745159.1 type VII secretion-associated serine protease mycosin [Actinoplanes octamycinicus]GIE62714.1 hypothetical protein Aoc01nite_81160 [Actinoplanes octamycinicus]
MRRGRRCAAATLAMTAAAVLGCPGVARAETVADYQRWYLTALRIKQAHRISKGAGVVVAVVDSGVHAAHPDLRGQVLPGHGTNPDSPKDGRTDPDTEVGHGTAMAGIIAARGGGKTHVLGIAPRAKILPVATGPEFTYRDVADGVRWAADHGADVINLSLVATDRNDVERAAIEYAMSKDVVVVAGSGNIEQGITRIDTPASIPGVIAVTGTVKSGKAWSGATHGPEAVLAAPVDKIISPAPPGVTDNGYGLSKGTSDASAIVSGVAALVRAKYPKLSAADVVNRLIRTADDRGPKGRDPEYGFGAVNPVAALTAKVPPVSANPLIAPGPAAGAAAAAPGEGEPAVTFPGGDSEVTWWQGGLCLAVVVAGVGLAVLSARRRRVPVGGYPTIPQQVGPPGYPVPPGHPVAPPGYPVAPPGYQPPPGYHPPAQQAPPGHYPPAGYPPAQQAPPGYYPPPGYPPPPQTRPGWPPPDRETPPGWPPPDRR